MTAARPRRAATAASTVLHTVPEAAKRLSVSENTVYRLIAGKHLRAVDLRVTGRKPKTRIRDDDLAAFIDGRTRVTA